MPTLSLGGPTEQMFDGRENAMSGEQVIPETEPGKASSMTMTLSKTMYALYQ